VEHAPTNGPRNPAVRFATEVPLHDQIRGTGTLAAGADRAADALQVGRRRRHDDHHWVHRLGNAAHMYAVEPVEVRQLNAPRAFVLQHHLNAGGACQKR
jgi:hypothetical protein